MEGPIKPFSTDNTAEIQRLELALESAGVGTWELNFDNNTFRWCRRTKALFNFQDEDIVPYETVLELVHPDDRSELDLAMRSAYYDTADEPFAVEFRLNASVEHPIESLLCRGQSYRKDGTPRLLGTFIDSTSEVQNRQRIKSHERQTRTFQTIVEQAPLAIGFLSGRDMIVEFGNDKIFELWGKDRSVMGMKLVEALPEIKDQHFLQLLEQVYDSGIPAFGTATLARLERNGQKEEAYFDFVYTPIREESGDVSSIMVLATEVTQQVLIRKELEESEAKFRSLIEQVPVAICLFVGRDMVVELANQPMLGYWGKDVTAIGKPLALAMPELVGQPFLDILDNVFNTGQSYSSQNAAVDIEVNGVLGTYYFNFTYKPLIDKNGAVYGIINMSIDVTKEVLALRALEESEAKLRSVISASPVAMSLFVGPDYVVEMPNQAFIDVVGKGPGIIGMPLRYAMPELESQPFLQILNDVYTKGEMYRSSGDQVSIVRDGIMTKNYYNITYTPLRDSEGNVNAILGTGADVTEGVVTQKKIEESQMQLLALFEQSTVAIAIIAAENLTFTMANPRYGKLVRRDPASIVGKSLLDALPELAGQGFDELLNEVIKTGIPFLATEQPVDIIEDGQLTKIYVDFTYQPKKELDGSITGVLVLATDVTPQVQSREKIREAESTLRGAVELADLGTWQINLSTGILDYSQRLREWFGILNDETITIERAYSAIRELDRPAVKAAITHAITLGTNQIFDVEYQVNKELTGKQRILHAQGRAYFNEKGEAVKINGTVQDVTEQRKIQLALEQQVKERTEEIEITNQELAASNEELASINEEYLAINEELAKSNDLLARSNENLQQFAYVASHDLQEPLRKVQSFGDLLKQRYSSELGEGVAYVQRMQAASGRMSVLIEDLLTFSRISTKQDSTEEISLMKVVNTVLSDLEVSIHESNAHITVEALPVVTGDESQFGQLFQNLISNALKFRKSGVNPEIEINYTVTKSENLPARAKPTRYTPAYHCIKVIDNGIGFDDRNSDRIFQVFQRLHGKNQYAGTGIGLAICEKVMANHGGAIVANSQIGLGSTFSIFLPF